MTDVSIDIQADVYGDLSATCIVNRNNVGARMRHDGLGSAWPHER